MFKWIKYKIMKMLGERFFTAKVVIDDNVIKKSNSHSIYFKSISKIAHTPSNDSIGNTDFIEVVHKNKPLWVLFKCPCGCQYVITLPLQKSHNPYWTITESKMGRPILYPSVWQNKGCCSHFWIEDGKVYWCRNTGTPPLHGLKSLFSE